MENLRPASTVLDLAVIGGGPAGTAAALEARSHGLRVGIWERERFPRDKVCGEFISPEALPLLQTAIPRTMARGTAIRSAIFVPNGGLARAFCLPLPALGLSRRLLDAALWDAAKAAGVEVHEAECIRKVRKLTRGHRQANTWEIEADGGNARRATALIIASGRWWAIEGLSSPARQNGCPKRKHWIGAKAHFAGIPDRGAVEMYFFRGGYCGLAPVENGACNVCCLVQRERVREYSAKGMDDFSAWLLRMSRQPALEARLRGSAQVSSVVTTAPVYLARGQAAQRGALMVGDASGFLDPFTGEGISMALHSGRLAARAIARSLLEGFGEEQMVEIYGRSLAQAVRQSYKLAGIARAFIDGPAWAQSLVAVPLPWIGSRMVRETRWLEKTRTSS